MIFIIIISYLMIGFAITVPRLVDNFWLDKVRKINFLVFILLIFISMISWPAIFLRNKNA